MPASALDAGRVPLHRGGWQCAARFQLYFVCRLRAGGQVAVALDPLHTVPWALPRPGHDETQAALEAMRARLLAEVPEPVAHGSS